MPCVILIVILCVGIGLLSFWRRAQRGIATRASELERANEELKTARSELQRRWRYLSEAQRLSHSGTFEWNVGTGEVLWSDEVYSLLGYTREATPSLERALERIHPDDVGRIRDLADHATRDALDLETEHRLLLPDGAIRHVHTVAHAGRNDAGHLEYVGVMTDITERKRADEERQAMSRSLQESNAKLEEAQRVAHLGYFEWNLETNENIWSAETYRIYGLTPQEGPIDIAAISDMMHPDDREFVFRAAEEALRTGGRPNAEHRIVRPTGEVRTVHSLGDVKRNAAGQAYLMFGTVQDVTDRKRAEGVLRQTQIYLAEGQRLAHMGSWASNDGERYASDELYKIYGLDPANGYPTEEQVLALMHPQDRASMAETIRAMREQRCGCDVTKRIVRPDGELRYIRWVGIPNLEHGVFKGFLGTAIDVTEQELLTQELRRERAYLMDAQRLTHTGSWACNLLTQEVFHLSEENFHMYGVDPSQGPVSFATLSAATHPADNAALWATFEKAIPAGADWDIEFRINRINDGSVRVLHALGHHSPSDELGEYVGITVDITDRKHAEEERERLRQLEADLAHINRVNMMGQLAAALAHEMRQPIAAAITSANACLQWLAHDPPDLGKARAAATRVERDGNRAAEVMNRLLSFYKKGAHPERGAVDVNGVIREMTALLRTEAARHSVTIHSDLRADMPHILADRVQLQQVLMNLMLNAIEAMESTGGALTIRARPNAEDQVVISVSDVGVGLPAEGIERIFDAFHTTKPQGTGMGLAITRSIVEAHGGRVWATANEGAGATFHFTLPSDQRSP